MVSLTEQLAITLAPAKILEAGPGFAFVILGIDLAGVVLVSLVA